MIDFATFKLNWKPNQFLMAPPGLCANAEPHAESPTFAETPDSLMNRFRAIALAQPRVAEKTGEATGNQTVFVAKSRIFRFPDVIDVRTLDAGEGRSTLAIYSRAKIGIRDFGVNEKRINDWVARLKA
ncbi:DUF1499 domain-containing protein [Minwuia sp.]|uniref:DUF1499 domain-containing protein n=1 Tax=Minwuia sp. TaxID=2493630 RepID=UPI003A9209EE